MAEKGGSHNDTDNHSPFRTFTPPKYKHISEERPSMKSTAENGNDQAQGDNIFESRGLRAPGSYGRRAEFFGGVLARRRFRTTSTGKAAGRISITVTPTRQHTMMSGQSGGKFPNPLVAAESCITAMDHRDVPL